MPVSSGEALKLYEMVEAKGYYVSNNVKKTWKGCERLSISSGNKQGFQKKRKLLLMKGLFSSPLRVKPILLGLQGKELLTCMQREAGKDT